MNHPDLEAQLEALKDERKKEIEEFRDLANEAMEQNDRAGKTMVVFMEDLQENKSNGTSTEKKKKGPTSKFLKIKRKKKK